MICRCRFQKAVADKLAPIEVDPNDKSVKAFFTRARNAALKGMTHDIHADIKHDDELTAVGVMADVLRITVPCRKLAGNLPLTSAQGCMQWCSMGDEQWTIPWHIADGASGQTAPETCSDSVCMSRSHSLSQGLSPECCLSPLLPPADARVC